MDGPEPPRSSPPALATEFLERHAAGEDPDVSEYLRLLDSPASRDEFRQIVSASLNGDGGSPEVSADPEETEEAVEFEEEARPDVQAVGPYEVVMELGSSGHCTVYQAWDPKKERDVVVKTYPPFTVKEADRRAHFLEEVRILARLNHRNLQRVYGARALRSERFVVTELVTGRTLAEVLEDLRAIGSEPSPQDLLDAIGGQLPDGDESLSAGEDYYGLVARILVELLKGLELVHKQGLHHWNMKPENIILKAGGHPVLLDFSLAGGNAMKGGKVPKGFQGRANYLAPEQVKRMRHPPDRRTDVYQVGLILYEMLTLQPALDGNTPRKVLAQARSGKIDNPRKLSSAIPKDLAEICVQAFKPHPDHRYYRSRDLRLDLERFLQGEPIAQRVPGRIEWGVYHIKVQRKRILIVLLLVALFVVVMVWKPDLGGPSIEMQPFVITGDASNVAPMKPGDPLPDGVLIGVEADADAATMIYALTVRGTSVSRARLVLPVRPFLLQNFGSDAPRSFGLALPEGVSAVCFAPFSREEYPGGCPLLERRRLDLHLTQPPALDGSVVRANGDRRRQRGCGHGRGFGLAYGVVPTQS